MDKEMFSPMEIDAIGEMMNISLGSSATAVSNMLDHRVDITTPKVSVVDVKDFTIGKLEPAMGVEIKYVEGLEGSNIMLLRKSDIKVIVDILMGSETPDEEFELNELTISAVCEVMNQMMGAAATALSDFLGYPVNISTPTPFELENLDEFKKDHLPQGADQVVVVRFSLKIENALESEFMNVMSVSLAKELLRGLGLGDEDEKEAPPAPAPEPAPAPASDADSGSGGGKQLSQAEIEALMAGNAGGGDTAPAPEPAPAPASDEDSGSGGKQLSQAEIEALMAANMGGGDAAPAPAPAPAPAAQPQPQTQPQPQAQPAAAAMPQQPPMAAPTPEGMPAGGYMGYPPPMYYPNYPYPYGYPPQAAPTPPEPKVINTKPVSLQEMDPISALGKEQAQNLDLIMGVPLQVTVEIGRTQRKVQEILEFSKGSLLVLDKLAGDQVDLFVNGKCIAKGDVVVIDDNFGVRITEIVQKPGLEEQTGE
mgnify:CR=1 FL=1